MGKSVTKKYVLSALVCCLIFLLTGEIFKTQTIKYHEETLLIENKKSIPYISARTEYEFNYTYAVLNSLIVSSISYYFINYKKATC